MMSQEFELKRLDWAVSVFYEVGPDDAGEVLSALRKCGCRGVNLRRAEKAIKGGGLNFGVTYSNYKRRQSVMVIGRTSSADEFQNSYDHEKGHLQKQICQRMFISPWGEEAEYLAGAIGQATFPMAKHLLCEHCRRVRRYAS